ncbi:tRNA pseudouridine(55) synthase TruB [Stenomitos frigidus]|uniref:tRNA pseudouridine synthase B n=1 Tax=Stenomitos frigidus ULC18 TaxID=2107698 RepID=A0A2T1EJE3_9CYAN|nr:tRNA pseudouridine(55) synthase TruB [Stenomitos frigidus]PSB32805.1 tRNA pseudouridine(55) synthase TruB [Stenomitos frigidus ULC18]
MDGFLNLNKPSGFTSHDCVAKMRRLLQMKRVGHAGTLDPAAIGVLPIALGRATRLLQFLRQDKAYRATVRLGVSTTTDDLEGEVLLAQPVAGLSFAVVQAALQQFQGSIQQVPPNYSAIQVKGKRLYDLARAGETIAVQPRRVKVFSIEVLAWRSGEFPELDLAIACGPGTYIRSIARDLGNALKTGGTLASLTRTSSSGFDLAKSLTFDAVEAQMSQETFQPLEPVLALTHLSPITLPAAIAKRWCQGQRIAIYPTAAGRWEGLEDAETGKPKDADSTQIYAVEPLQQPLRVHHEEGHFLGIGKPTDTEVGIILLPQMVFEA